MHPPTDHAPEKRDLRVLRIQAQGVWQALRTLSDEEIMSESNLHPNDEMLETAIYQMFDRINSISWHVLANDAKGNSGCNSDFINWWDVTFKTVPQRKDALLLYNQMVINALALKFDELFKAGYVHGKLAGTGQTPEEALANLKKMFQQEGFMPKDGETVAVVPNNVPKKDDLN